MKLATFQKNSGNIFHTLILLLLIIITIFSQHAKANPTDISHLFGLSIEQLMTVKVTTASKTAQKTSEIPASTVIITRDEIEKFGYQTLEEIFQNISGFFGIDDYGEYGMLFGVRGFWSGVANDNIIILINNVPQTKNTFSNHPLAAIPVNVESIDRIEVVRGPISIIYGSGAFFGAVNIITNELSEEHQNLVSTGFGSSNTGKAAIRISQNSNNLKITANAGYYQTDGIDQPARNLMSNPENLENFGHTADYTTGKSLNQKKFYFDLSATMNDFYTRIVLVEAKDGVHFSFPSYGKGHTNFMSDFNVTLGYNTAVNPKLDIDTKITLFKDRSAYKYRFFNKDFFGIQQIESRAVEYTLDTFYHPTEKLDIQCGLLFKSIFTNYNLYDLPSFGDPFFNNTFISLDDGNEINSLGVYSQIVYKPKQKVHLVAGLRAEKAFGYTMKANFSHETPIYYTKERQIDKGKTEFIPRLAGIYNFNPYNSLKLMYGTAINRTSFFQDYLQMQAEDRPLSPEKISTIELNYETVVFSDYHFGINIFHNEMENLITRLIFLDETGNYDFSYFDNAGKLVTNGLEFTVNAKPTDKLYLQASTTLQKTSNKQKGFKDIDPAYSPEILGYIKLSYNILDNLTLGINGRYVGEMLPLWDVVPNTNFKNYVPTGRIGQKSPSYSVFGLNFRLNNFIKPGMFLNARVSNIFDTEIRFPVFTNNAWANKGTLAQGRTLFGTLGISF